VRLARLPQGEWVFVDGKPDAGVAGAARTHLFDRCGPIGDANRHPLFEEHRQSRSGPAWVPMVERPQGDIAQVEPVRSLAS
jgi:hypothetical protein